MSEDELQDSFATWIPPWQRITKPSETDADAEVSADDGDLSDAEIAIETPTVVTARGDISGHDDDQKWVRDPGPTGDEPAPDPRVRPTGEPEQAPQRPVEDEPEEPEYQQPETDRAEAAPGEAAPSTTASAEASAPTTLADALAAWRIGAGPTEARSSEARLIEAQPAEFAAIEVEVPPGDLVDLTDGTDEPSTDERGTDERGTDERGTDEILDLDADVGGEDAPADGERAPADGDDSPADGEDVSADPEGAPGEEDVEEREYQQPETDVLGALSMGTPDGVDLEAESDGLDNLPAALEAILMVVDSPVAEETLADVVRAPVGEVNAALADLADQYTKQGRGFELRRAAGGWRFYTRGDYADYVERFVLDGQSVRLTQAALETLAVIAYQQPVSRSRMSAIRGVNCDGVVRTLNSRGLIEECGQQPESGAFLYRTTPLFLEKLGLDSIDELPPLAPFLPDDVNGFADA